MIVKQFLRLIFGSVECRPRWRWVIAGMAGLLVGAAPAIFAEGLDRFPPPLVAERVDSRDLQSRPSRTVPAITYEQRVLELVNQERQNNGGLAPLKGSSILDTSAEGHSTNMGTRDFFAHCDLDTKTSPVQRAIAAGYGSSFVGENIAMGQSSPESVVSSWMGSSGHRANILSTSYRELGNGYYYDSVDSVGIRKDANGDCIADDTYTYAFYHYWTQNFGSQAVYPVVINREEHSTTQRTVSLYSYGDAVGATQMRMRNEAGTWSAWATFSALSSWELSNGGGWKTVTMEVSNGSSTYSASDEIYLDQVWSCDGTDVELGAWTFAAGTTTDCTATSSFATVTGDVVTVESTAGLNITSPTTSLNPGFWAVDGSCLFVSTVSQPTLDCP